MKALESSREEEENTYHPGCVHLSTGLVVLYEGGVFERVESGHEVRVRRSFVEDGCQR